MSGKSVPGHSGIPVWTEFALGLTADPVPQAAATGLNHGGYKMSLLPVDVPARPTKWIG